MKDIIVLCGFSASGKDTLARELEKEGYHFVVSTSSRPMRDFESDGNPYHFVIKEKFLEKAKLDEFIEIRSYETLVNNKPETWYYGVEKREVSGHNKCVVVLDLLGLRGFKEAFSEKVLSFFIYADKETRKQRCIERGDFDESEFHRRLKDDEEQFPEDLINAEVDYIIESAIVPVDLEEILDIIDCETS